jgi:hypothetical protein
MPWPPLPFRHYQNGNCQNKELMNSLNALLSSSEGKESWDGGTMNPLSLFHITIIPSLVFSHLIYPSGQ